MQSDPNSDLVRLEVSEVIDVVEDEGFGEVLELECHSVTVYVEVRVHSGHQRAEAHVGLRLVPHGNQQWRGQVTHALAVAYRRVVQGIPKRNRWELLLRGIKTVPIRHIPIIKKGICI